MRSAAAAGRAASNDQRSRSHCQGCRPPDSQAAKTPEAACTLPQYSGSHVNTLQRRAVYSRLSPFRGFFVFRIIYAAINCKLLGEDAHSAEHKLL